MSYRGSNRLSKKSPWNRSFWLPVLAIFLGTILQGQEVVDQCFEPRCRLTLGSNITSGVDKAQTFTVGVEGTLTSIDLLVRGVPGGSDLMIDIRGVTPGDVPTESDSVVVESVTIPNASVPVPPPPPPFLRVHLTSGITVSPGDVFAIVLRAESNYSWEGRTDNSYTGGAHYIRNPGLGITTWTLTDADHDVGFKTYVTAAGGPQLPGDCSPCRGAQLPGDCNQDGVLDLSDAVCALGVLFNGNPAFFPCGDGSPTDPSNIALMDWQPDGSIDLSDAVAMLQFLFFSTAAHTLAVPGSETTECVFIPECDAGFNCL